MSKNLRIAMLSPVAWRTPPRQYGPWEQMVSFLTEGLVAKGVEVTLFATGDSFTSGTLRSVVPVGYEEDKTVDRKVAECLHISEVFEHADEFDLIHNNFDFLPLSYTKLVKTPVLTTIHGFSSPRILPVYQKYNTHVSYVSISNADRDPSLEYLATIHHGIDLHNFHFQDSPEDYLLFFGRIDHQKGTAEAIEIARRVGKKLIIAGLTHDMKYYQEKIEPQLDGKQVVYVGNVGPEKRNTLLGKASALLHPINFNEPFGLSVVEAMACGTPVIAFAKGSMPELIKPGETGFLVHSIDEAVQAVAKIPKISRQQCRLHVEEKFTVTRMVEQYLQAYQQLLAR